MTVFGLIVEGDFDASALESFIRNHLRKKEFT